MRPAKTESRTASRSGDLPLASLSTAGSENEQATPCLIPARPNARRSSVKTDGLLTHCLETQGLSHTMGNLVTLTFVDGDAVGEGVCEGGLGVAECHACLDAGTRQGHTTPARLLLRTWSKERGYVYMTCLWSRVLRAISDVLSIRMYTCMEGCTDVLSIRVNT